MKRQRRQWLWPGDQIKPARQKLRAVEDTLIEKISQTPNGRTTDAQQCPTTPNNAQKKRLVERESNGLQEG